MCYYFNDNENWSFWNWYFNRLQIILKCFSYNILCKGLTNSKTLHIRFDKIDGFIRVYDGTRYLVLFGSEKYDSIRTGLDIL